jgi:hypothetical protein
MIAKGPIGVSDKAKLEILIPLGDAKPHGQPGNLQVGDMDENPLDSRTPKKKRKKRGQHRHREKLSSVIQPWLV